VTRFRAKDGSVVGDWQGHDPRASDGMEALDNRRSYVGRTLVYSDRHGPYQFWRAGVQVPCVCDPGHLVCAYHAPGDFDPAVWGPIPANQAEAIK
jgi:hypothetical protein